MIWDSISPQDAPQAVSVYAIKGILKVYEIHMELPLPFRTLFYDVILKSSSSIPAAVSGPILNNSAFKLSCPAALLFFSFFMAIAHHYILLQNYNMY